MHRLIRFGVVLVLAMLAIDAGPTPAGANAGPATCLSVAYLFDHGRGGIGSIIINPQTGSQIANDRGGVPAPSARQTAFLNDDNRLQIWDMVKKSTVNAVQYANDTVSFIFWSPDSQYLAVEGKESSGTTRLSVFRPTSPQPVWSQPVKLTVFDRSEVGAWSPHSDQLAYLNQLDGHTLTVTLLSIADGTSHTVPVATDMADKTIQVRFFWAPDGRNVAVLVNDGDSAYATLTVIASDGSAIHTVTHGFVFDPASGPPQIFWQPDGRALFFVDDSNDLITLKAVYPDGTLRLTVPVYRVEIAPDKRHVLVFGNDGDFLTPTGVLDTTTGTQVKLPALNVAGPSLHYADWSTDNRSWVALIDPNIVLQVTVDGTAKVTTETGRVFFGFIRNGPISSNEKGRVDGAAYSLGNWLTFFEQDPATGIVYEEFLEMRTLKRVEYTSSEKNSGKDDYIPDAVIAGNGQRLLLKQQVPDASGTTRTLYSLLAVDGTQLKKIKDLPDDEYALGAPDLPIFAALGYKEPQSFVLIHDLDGNVTQRFDLPDGGVDGPPFNWIPCP